MVEESRIAGMGGMRADLTPQARRLMTLTGRTTVAGESLLHTSDLNASVLELAVALVSSSGFEAQHVQENTVKCIYTQAVLQGLRAGCTQKLAGGLLADILFSQDEGERAKLLQCLEAGGYESFLGAKVNGIRDCAYGECVMPNKVVCKGAWIAGKMYGRGDLQHGEAAGYKGYFAESRPHGKGVMYGAGGRVDYKGMFQFGMPHGQGTRYNKNKGFSRGQWVFGELTCANGECEEVWGDTVQCYAGDLVKGAKHGAGVLSIYERVNGTTKGGLLSCHRGGFVDDLKSGVGVQTTTAKSSEGAGVVLGVWWKGLLLFTLSTTDDPLSEYWTCDLDALLNDASRAFKQNAAAPRECMRQSAEAACQTTEVSGETEPAAAPPAEEVLAAEPPPHPIEIYSVCTLSSIPRKEGVTLDSYPIHALPNIVPGGAVFFVNGSQIPIPSRVTTTGAAKKKKREKSLLIRDVLYGHKKIFVVRCAVCTELCNMQSASNGAHAAFEIIECAAVGCLNRSYSCIYCRICGQDEGRAGASLFRVDAGLKHMQAVHGIDIQAGG